MRRERGRWLIRNTLVSGSSPHARGTREEDYRELMNSRFIPACAGNADGSTGRGFIVAVHPRMRGERMRQILIEAARRGSSPHARGTRTLDAVVTLFKRFIPACAGNAKGHGSIRLRMSVHPRMRGERPNDAEQDAVGHGSSPHARGTQSFSLSIIIPWRFIPACAGNAWMNPVNWRESSVHPRMRGERTVVSRSTSAAVGSSPHARGTRHPGRNDWRCTRFIPACAGNAPDSTRRIRPCAVHPRMRGERAQRFLQTVDIVGSSPHARGTPIHCPAGHFSIRFIPACAGNAETGSHVTPNETVHPRMRGERLVEGFIVTVVAGSSPHARGTPRSGPRRRADRRFIPACAGNACQSSMPSVISAVHPRMRGERRLQLLLRLIPFGSSPHARGTRRVAHLHPQHGWFIPACAGNARQERPLSA